MDRVFFLPLPKAKGKVLQETAVSVLKRHILAASGEINIMAFGPMTNLADLLQAEPNLAQKITMIYQMGGALEVGGNLHDINKSIDNPYAEWNIYIDPTAADIVFRSGVALTLVPLDTTNHAPLTEDYIARFAAENQHPSTNFILKEMRRIFPLMTENKFYFWDVLAAAIATHPQIAQFETRKLRVITEEGRESGRIIADPNGSEIRVCSHIDEAAFKRIFLNTLNMKEQII
jgi:pyrimidine-specific ribonucleoside hydrolase